MSDKEFQIIGNTQFASASILLPKYAWKCQLHSNTYWYVHEGKQPNAFHRFMQRLCFGVKWSRINE